MRNSLARGRQIGYLEVAWENILTGAAGRGYGGEEFVLLSEFSDFLVFHRLKLIIASYWNHCPKNMPARPGDAKNGVRFFGQGGFTVIAWIYWKRLLERKLNMRGPQSPRSRLPAASARQRPSIPKKA
jgi:hypothetical protein